jgi:glycosyltransferase involved in cell wall biosynthesis
VTDGRRVALVVQRYGHEVNGGAETLARRIATLLAPHVDLTVLTTCALDYRTWANHFDAGETVHDGVRVRRFPVDHPRKPAAFDELSARAYARAEDATLGWEWMRAQGPVTSALIEELRATGHSYDAVAFVTYLYWTTARVIGTVPGKAVLVPTLHDEPPARLAIFDEVFRAARLVLFSTAEERALARDRFGVGEDRARLVGAGLDPPPPSDGGRFRSLIGGRPYVLCVGRLDASKGVVDLAEAHARYRDARPDGPDLVLMGGGDAPVPRHPWLHRTGFVDEQTKHDAFEGAAVVVVPSAYESLSFSQLEAWSHGRPTLANARSPVLVGQSRRSGGGLWYADADEYTVMLDLLVRAAPLADAIGRQGRWFVEAHCSWDRVRDAWLAAIEEVAESARLHSAR